MRICDERSDERAWKALVPLVMRRSDIATVSTKRAAILVMRQRVSNTARRSYLPLSRDSTDLSKIKNFKSKSCIIFPEGTTLNSLDLKKSIKHAKSRNQNWYEPQSTLLFPRYKGLQNLLSNNSGYTSTTLIYKGYSGELPSYEIGYDRIEDRVLSFKILLSYLPSFLLPLDDAINDKMGYKEYKYYYRTERGGFKVKFDYVPVPDVNQVEKILNDDWKKKSHYIDVNKGFGGSLRDSENNMFVEREPGELRRYWILAVLMVGWVPVGISYFIWLICGGWVVVGGVVGWKYLIGDEGKGAEIVKVSKR